MIYIIVLLLFFLFCIFGAFLKQRNKRIKSEKEFRSQLESLRLSEYTLNQKTNCCLLSYQKQLKRSMTFKQG